jgi:hypothetical protein
LGRADNFAGGLISNFDTRCIEIAFGCGFAIGIDVKRIIGTGLHAGLAADAAFVIEINYSISSSEQRHRGTNFDARRVVAMIAAQHGEVAAGIGIAALFNVFNPRAIYTDGDVVLFLARDGAGVTADAAVLVDEKSVAHEIFLNSSASPKP